MDGGGCRSSSAAYSSSTIIVIATIIITVIAIATTPGIAAIGIPGAIVGIEALSVHLWRAGPPGSPRAVLTRYLAKGRPETDYSSSDP
jgi:hypothetical protein